MAIDRLKYVETIRGHRSLRLGGRVKSTMTSLLLNKDDVIFDSLLLGIGGGGCKLPV